MNIQEFINNKIVAMRYQGYREVEYLSAMDCTLTSSGTEESFMAYESNLEHECQEFEFHKTSENETFKGSKIRIYAIPKRKRKGEVKIFYVQIVDDLPRKIERDKLEE